MASVENLAKNAIYSEASGDSTLWNSVGGRFYYVNAGTGAAKPYVIYSLGISARYNVLGKRPPTASDFPVYFDIFSTSTIGVPTEAETIQSYITDVFDAATLSLTGYSDVILSRGPGQPPRWDEETGMWHVHESYMAIACKT